MARCSVNPINTANNSRAHTRFPEFERPFQPVFELGLKYRDCRTRGLIGPITSSLPPTTRWSMWCESYSSCGSNHTFLFHFPPPRTNTPSGREPADVLQTATGTHFLSKPTTGATVPETSTSWLTTLNKWPHGSSMTPRKQHQLGSTSSQWLSLIHI